MWYMGRGFKWSDTEFRERRRQEEHEFRIRTTSKKKKRKNRGGVRVLLVSFNRFYWKRYFGLGFSLWRTKFF